MKFFSDVKNSIYNPQYYQGLISKPFSYSLKYFFVVIILLSALATVFFSFNVIPGIASGIVAVKSNILQYYPDNLEISIKGGKVSTNAQEPYIIKAAAGNDTQKEISSFKNVLVIDTKTDFSLSQFKNYKTYALLGREDFAYYEKDNEIKIISLAGMPDFTLNKDKILSFFSKVEPWLPLLYHPACILFFFGGIFLGMCLGYLIYLLLAALLIWLVAKIKKLGIGYKKSYQLGLHLLTVPLAVNFLVYTVLGAFVPNLFHVPFMFTVILLVMAFINFKNKLAPVAGSAN